MIAPLGTLYVPVDKSAARAPPPGAWYDVDDVVFCPPDLSTCPGPPNGVGVVSVGVGNPRIVDPPFSNNPVFNTVHPFRPSSKLLLVNVN